MNKFAPLAESAVDDLHCEDNDSENIDPLPSRPLFKIAPTPEFQHQGGMLHWMLCCEGEDPYQRHWRLGLEFTVNSGATESVVPTNSLQSVKTEQGEKSMRGVEYESACGTSLPNDGENKSIISTDDSPVEEMAVLQVANIGKSLLSVSKLVDKGYHPCIRPIRRIHLQRDF